MKFLLYLTVFILVGGFICVKTKPGKSEHVDSVAVAVVNEIQAGNFLPGITETALSGIATNTGAVRRLLKKMLVVESYGVFTLGKLKWMEKEYVVSLGILGKVFTFADARVAGDYMKSLGNIDVEELLKEDL